MRRIAVAMVAVVLLVAVATPAIARTYSVGVQANQGWTGTGIWVGGGETIAITASGSVKTIGTEAAVRMGGTPPIPVVGPAGGTATCGSAKLDPAEYGACLVSDAPWGALVGMVYGQTFAIGDSGVIHIPTLPAGVANSQLYLAANDVDHTFYDNAGSFIVIFRY